MAVLWTIRVARQSDAHVIAALSRAVVEHDLPGWKYPPRVVAMRVRDPDSEVIVAESNGEVVGFAILEVGWDDAHLALFGVAPAMRRQGLGTAMLRWLEVLARTAGVLELRLEVRAPNHTARHFYRDMGYEEDGVLPDYYGQGVEDAILMSRDLTRDF